MSHYPHSCTIVKSLHYFTVNNPTPRIIPIVYQLSREYTQYGLVYNPKTRRKTWSAIKTYGIYARHGKQFRFHIGQFEHFLTMLERGFVDRSSYDIVEDALWHPERIEIGKNTDLILRDYQEEAKSFAIDDMSPENAAPLLMIAPGTGKTLISCFSAAEIGWRIGVVVLGGFVDKWVGDLQYNLGMDASEICAIQGSDSLIRATSYPGSGLPMPKAFVISINTMNKWYDMYEKDDTDPRLDAYDCLPWEFFQHLGIGTSIMDEVHLHPYAVFRFLTYCNAMKVISLSATLLTKETTLRAVQSMMFPKTKRFDNVALPKYATVHACAYQIMNFNQSKIQTTQHGQSMYSHSAYEASILSKRQRAVKAQYFKMILDLIQRGFVDIKIDGDKLLILVTTKEMAKQLTEAIKQRFPKYDTRWYLDESEKKDLYEPEIIVSTDKSAGTAVDIPNLRVAIQTTNVDSPNANVQALGRLREMKHREVDNDVHYYQLYCSSIPKHVEYHRNRTELFSTRIKYQAEEFIGTIYPALQGGDVSDSIYRKEPYIAFLKG